MSFSRIEFLHSGGGVVDDDYEVRVNDNKIR
jgi:hypothetical protein